jgi:hypothetical protein
MNELRSRVAAVYREELAEELAAGLPILRRIPCTQVIRLVDYLTGLDPGEQANLMDGLAWFASVGATPELFAAEWAQAQQHPAIARMRAALAFRGVAAGYRYTPIKILSGIAGNEAGGGLAGWFKNFTFSDLEMRPSEELLPPPHHVEAVKPARLKRLVDKAFAALYAPQRSTAGSELTQYAGVFESWKTIVKVLFAPSGRQNPRQLQYIVTLTSSDPNDGRLPGGGIYEGLWSLNTTWDYITEENAERSVETLRDLIVRLVRLANRVGELARRGT